MSKRGIGRRGEFIVRLVVAAAACAALIAGCGSAEPAGSVSLSAADVADISAQAAAAACARYCDDSQVYVLDEIVARDAQSGDETVMPVDMQQSLMASMDRTEIITQERHEGMFADGMLIEPGAVVVYVGPVDELGDGLVGIDIGVATRGDGYRADTYLFRSTGSGWEPASPEESGVTVTTSVS